MGIVEISASVSEGRGIVYFSENISSLKIPTVVLVLAFYVGVHTVMKFFSVDVLPYEALDPIVQGTKEVAEEVGKAENSISSFP